LRGVDMVVERLIETFGHQARLGPVRLPGNRTLRRHRREMHHLSGSLFSGANIRLRQ
jgi:hypothetical protein